jgi:hypothetical protein
VCLFPAHVRASFSILNTVNRVDRQFTFKVTLEFFGGPEAFLCLQVLMLPTSIPTSKTKGTQVFTVIKISRLFAISRNTYRFPEVAPNLGEDITGNSVQRMLGLRSPTPLFRGKK